MEKDIVKDLIALWDEISSEKRVEYKNLEAELYHKLLNFVQIGNFYYFIFNFEIVDIEFLSDSVKDVLGYEKEIFDMPFCFSKIHPEDQPYFFNFENESVQFYLSLPIEKRKKYKTSMDFRMQKKDGSYVRILHQVAIIEQFEDGTFFRTLGVHTDITHIKAMGKPILSFIGMDGEPSYINVTPGNPIIKVEESISDREKEILLLLIDGKRTSEIAAQLYISYNTVETHRKNMMRKTNAQTTGQLTAMAILNGWL